MRKCSIHRTLRQSPFWVCRPPSRCRREHDLDVLLRRRQSSVGSPRFLGRSRLATQSGFVWVDMKMLVLTIIDTIPERSPDTRLLGPWYKVLIRRISPPHEQTEKHHLHPPHQYPYPPQKVGRKRTSIQIASAFNPFAIFAAVQNCVGLMTLPLKKLNTKL